MKGALMNRLPLVFVAVLWLVVTSTIAGPDNIVFPSSYENHVRYATVGKHIYGAHLVCSVMAQDASARAAQLTHQLAFVST
jgi:hypothetical protein